jgi:hypothetical protein
LRQASAVKELSEHPGWVEYLKPLLETKLNQSFPDPSQFKDEKEFTYAAMNASVFKKVIAELMMYIEGNKEAFKQLQSKKFRKHNQYSIGK